MFPAAAAASKSLKAAHVDQRWGRHRVNVRATPVDSPTSAVCRSINRIDVPQAGQQREGTAHKVLEAVSCNEVVCIELASAMNNWNAEAKIPPQKQLTGRFCFQ